MWENVNRKLQSERPDVTKEIAAIESQEKLHVPSMFMSVISAESTSLY